jgi:hypothetical protein
MRKTRLSIAAVLLILLTAFIALGQPDQYQYPSTWTWNIPSDYASPGDNFYGNMPLTGDFYGNVPSAYEPTDNVPYAYEPYGNVPSTDGFYGNAPSTSTGARNAPTPSTAPTHSTPATPESLGIQIPESPTPSQEPTLAESDQSLIQSSESAARSRPAGAERATSSTSMLIVPGGVSYTNGLYVSYAPLTVAASNLYGSLPLWLQVSGRRPLWTYEWYPNGRLDG